MDVSSVHLESCAASDECAKPTNLRIAVIGPSFPYRGGIAHYTALLCSSLAALHQVKLVSFSRLYPSIFFPGKTQTDESEARIEVEGTERLVDSINPASWIRAAGAIHRFHPDLVILQWWHPFFSPAYSVIAGLCRRFAKVMFICHNVLPHEQTGPVKILTKRALSKGDVFIVHSDEDTRNLESLLPGRTVRKARHPIYEVFNTTLISRQEARSELGLSYNEKIILFFGLVREYKGLRYLIEAMPMILSSLDAKLLIAGEFYDNRDGYMRSIKRLDLQDRIIVKDEYIPNESVAAYFTASDLVVLPYISATQSGIVQIAYAFNRPVVTTNVGGLPEAVLDGATGFIAPSKDPEALAEAVVRFFKEDRADEFSENISVFREEFTWERLVGIIEEAAASSGGSQC